MTDLPATGELVHIASYFIYFTAFLIIILTRGDKRDILYSLKRTGGTFYTPYVKHFFQEIIISEIIWLFSLSCKMAHLSLSEKAKEVIFLEHHTISEIKQRKK
jgi:hypothetical protein